MFFVKMALSPIATVLQGWFGKQPNSHFFAHTYCELPLQFDIKVVLKPWPMEVLVWSPTSYTMVMYICLLL
jgi:hypothetical protein